MFAIKTVWHKNSHMHEPRTISLLGSWGNDVALMITIPDIPAIIKRAYKEVFLISDTSSSQQVGCIWLNFNLKWVHTLMDLWDKSQFCLSVGWWIQRLEEYVVWISRSDDSYLRLWILNNYNHRIHHIIRVSTKRFIINVTSVHNLVLLFQNEQLCHFKIVLILTHLSM